jgi:transposase
MDVIVERQSALDVHKAQVTGCVRIPGAAGERVEHVEQFQTTVRGLLVLRDWLKAHGVTHVVMEATGDYWRPVWHVLEDDFELMLVNARHVKQVPGRKTDVSDAAWLCQLAEAGLLRASFVPPKAIRELRQLTRYRRAQIAERKREAQRLHKALEDTGIKLDCVATDILGKSGRAMLDALVAGTTDPEVLAELARGKLRAKLPALREALEGRFEPLHALLIGAILSHLDFLDEQVERLSEAIEEQLRPFWPAVELLCTIPGVKQRTAELLIAEIGTDMSVFPSAGHLASWAGQCPGNDQSAGKRRSGKTRDGSKWLDFARRSRRGRDPRQGQLPRRAIPAPGAPTRTQARARCRQALTADRDLADAVHRRDLPRPRRRPLHPTRPRAPDQAPRQTARTPRPHRHAHRRSRSSLSDLFLSDTSGSAAARANATARLADATRWNGSARLHGTR